MSSFLSENFVKIITFITFTIAILGSIVQFASFRVDIQGYGTNRQLMVLGQDIIGAEFLSYAPNGEVVKGVFSKEKLDALNGDLSGKIKFAGMPKYFINITDSEKKSWLFGDGTVKTQTHLKYFYPISIRYSDKTVPAKVEIYFLKGSEK